MLKIKKTQTLHSYQLGFTERGIITIKANSVQTKLGNYTEFALIILYSFMHQLHY